MTKQPLYTLVVGAGHSGSTLVSLILGSHSQVVSVGELRVLGRHIAAGGLCTCRKPMADCEFWRDVLDGLAPEFGFDPFAEPDRLELDPVGAAARHGNVGHLVRRGLAAALGRNPHQLTWLCARIMQRTGLVLDAACRVAGAKVAVDSSKTPTYAKSLLGAFPDRTRLIFLVRDGRAFVESSVRRRGWTPEASARRWARINEQALDMFGEHSDEHRLLLRYEEFCDDPLAAVHALCQFTGVAFEPDMLRFREQSHHHVRGNVMRFDSVSEIRKNEVWRERLRPDALATFARIAGGVAQRLGYPP
jgi:hypothetical protein